MTAFARICCAVDFSETSRKALLEAADLARRDGSTLTVLHVREDPLGGGASPVGRSPGIENGRILPYLEALRGEAEWLRNEPVGSVVVTGPVAQSIATFARDTGADLLVLGCHGRTGSARWALGSVAEAVLRMAPCPVLVVRDGRELREETGAGAVPAGA